VQASSTVSAGGIQPVLIKYGPVVTFVMGASSVSSYSAAPGMAITIYGSSLENSQVLVNGKQIKVSSAAAGEIEAVLPAGILGLVALKVQNSLGSHTVDLMIEPSVPSLYAADGSGAGLVFAHDATSNATIDANNPARSGQTIALYGTGLSETTSSNGNDVARAKIVVTVGGVAAKMNFAGRAPGYPGIDLIEIQIPAGVKAGQANVLVYASNRMSNLVEIPVR
jgi:uncharacterized protein (TIGR03437 family)